MRLADERSKQPNHRKSTSQEFVVLIEKKSLQVFLKRPKHAATDLMESDPDSPREADHESSFSRSKYFYMAYIELSFRVFKEN